MQANKITPPINYEQNAGYNENCVSSYAGADERVGAYWYHPDHLGSSSFITGLDGEVTQSIDYFPSGEVFVENHKNSPNTPYKFNGKELDSETGYYYYGARYYNPRVSLWLNVDPLADYNPFYNTQHYIDGQHNGGVYNSGNLNPYIYTYQNPIRYIDPNGKQVDTTDSRSWVINWVPNDSHGHGINLLARIDNTRLGGNHFRIYAHGGYDGEIQFTFQNGYSFSSSNPKTIIKQISKVNPEFAKKMANGEDITLAFMICNERKSAKDQGLIDTAINITKKYPNIKSITVGTGVQIVSYDDQSASYEYYDSFATPDSNGRMGALVTVQNGKVTNTNPSFGHIPEILTEEERKNRYKQKVDVDNPDDDFTNVNKTWKTK